MDGYDAELWTLGYATNCHNTKDSNSMKNCTFHPLPPLILSMLTSYISSVGDDPGEVVAAVLGGGVAQPGRVQPGDSQLASSALNPSLFFSSFLLTEQLILLHVQNVQ